MTPDLSSRRIVDVRDTSRDGAAYASIYVSYDFTDTAGPDAVIHVNGGKPFGGRLGVFCTKERLTQAAIETADDSLIHMLQAGPGAWPDDPPSAHDALHAIAAMLLPEKAGAA